MTAPVRKSPRIPSSLNSMGRNQNPPIPKSMKPLLSMSPNPKKLQLIRKFTSLSQPGETSLPKVLRRSLFPNRSTNQSCISKSQPRRSLSLANQNKSQSNPKINSIPQPQPTKPRANRLLSTSWKANSRLQNQKRVNSIWYS
jgi:hypothetical protein